jgi:transmembrane sensor
MTSLARKREAAKLERIRTQAAKWVAVLAGPNRDAKMERFDRWLAADPRHRAAFESAAAVWRRTRRPANEPRQPIENFLPAGHPIARPAFAAATLCVLMATAAAYVHFREPEGVRIATDIGQQHQWSLPDGSKAELNTSTRLVVQFRPDRRQVTLDRGEAYFDVAKNNPLPFVVVAGSRKFIAVGTEFVVRRNQGGATPLVMTVVEGTVATVPASVPDRIALQSKQATRVSQGRRITFDAAGTATLDHPAIERILAWKRGRLVFEETPLREVVAEVNRYRHEPIRLESDRTGAIPITGSYRVKDLENFAALVADPYHLRVVKRGVQEFLAPDENANP